MLPPTPGNFNFLMNKIPQIIPQQIIKGEHYGNENRKIENSLTQ